MEDKLIEILETSFGFPVIRQGSLGDDEDYYDDFFTYWNNGTNEDGFYDNDNSSEIEDFDVNFYSNNPQNTYDILRQAKKKLKEQGFIIADSGHDVPSDVETHTGRGMNVLFINY